MLGTCGAVRQQSMYWRRLAEQVWQDGVLYIHLYKVYSLNSVLNNNYILENTCGSFTTQEMWRKRIHFIK